jgi:hypothetical protein
MNGSESRQWAGFAREPGVSLIKDFMNRMREAAVISASSLLRFVELLFNCWGGILRRALN